MRGETVDINTRDGVADAYLSRPPEDDRSHPGVLFLIDAFGLRARIEEMADRIAARGFVVPAPNVLYRAGRSSNAAIPDLQDPAQRDPFFARLRPAMEALTPERIVSDGAAYLDYLGELASPPVRDYRLLHGWARRLADRRRLPGAHSGARRLPRRRAGERRG